MASKRQVTEAQQQDAGETSGVPSSTPEIQEQVDYKKKKKLLFTKEMQTDRKQDEMTSPVIP